MPKNMDNLTRYGAAGEQNSGKGDASIIVAGSCNVCYWTGDGGSLDIYETGGSYTSARRSPIVGAGSSGGMGEEEVELSFPSRWLNFNLR